MIERTKQVWNALVGPLGQTSEGILQNEVDSQTGVVIGYIDLVQFFSAVFGRNLEQATIWRIVGVDVAAVVSQGGEFDNGFAASGAVRYYPPTGQRVAAHKWYAQKWHAQSRMGANAQASLEQSRGRQFYVKWDTAQTSVAYHSTMEDRASSTDVEVALGGTSVSGSAVSIFDEYDVSYPGYPAHASGGGEDQRLYTRKANDVVSTQEIIPWFFTASEGIDSPAGVAGDAKGQIFMSSWRPPAGHHVEWMTGQAQVTYDLSTPRQGSSVADELQLYLNVLVGGWRPMR